MSLISQSSHLKNGTTKSKRDDAHEISIVREGEDGKDIDTSVLITKKRKKDRNNEQLVMEQVREMKNLENALFGSLYSPLKFGREDENSVYDVTANDAAVFFTDRSVNTKLSVYGDDEYAGFSKESDDVDDVLSRKPAWVDEEELDASVNIATINRLRKLRKEEDESFISGSEYVSRLRAQHLKLNPGTEWAQIDSRSEVDTSDDDSTDEENTAVVARSYQGAEAVADILRTNEELVAQSSSKLLPGILKYSRLVDANIQDAPDSKISSVQFHSNGQMLLAAGLDKRVRFFQIDGKRNPKIESIFLKDFPIKKASFLADGSQVIISGRRKFAYSFDIVKAKLDRIGPLVGREEKSLEVFEVSPDSSMVAFVGNEGYILLVSTKTKELVGTLKMNGTVRSLAFAENGEQLLSSGGDGQVYHWDLRTRTCFHKAVDEGCINGSSLCTSPNGALFAAGSDSGIVNIYNRQEFLGGKRKPIKTIENLTTSVNFMKFNNDAQILAICSRMAKNGLKLIHVPSYNVFSNWPSVKTTLRYPSCLDFSPGGGFMAVGNAAGKVMLYKLHHYQHA